MQSAFSVFFQLGFDHILDPEAYDHLLFVVVLCAIYQLKAWRKVAILVTAFTIGHSLTLALSALDVVQFPAQLIEFLIPLTIIATALHNVLTINKVENSVKKGYWSYAFALFFGLIHGMAFSNFFKSTQMPGQEDQLLGQLFAFNVGVEVGQLLIVLATLVVSYLLIRLLKVPAKIWIYGISALAALFALQILLAQL